MCVDILENVNIKLYETGVIICVTWQFYLEHIFLYYMFVLFLGLNN